MEFSMSKSNSEMSLSFDEYKQSKQEVDYEGLTYHYTLCKQYTLLKALYILNREEGLILKIDSNK